MLSDKPGVRNLVELCAAKGIRHVIISPGSRNAPLNISFNEHGAFECISVPDERCAAFVALGIGQHTGQPAIVCCTSGSAALNFAPAIVEAYYQRIPMLILTADRPPEWIDQGEGQSMRQSGVYANYIKKDYDLPLETQDQDNLAMINRIVNEAIHLTTSDIPGPVHINIPFREPLYGRKDWSDIPLPKSIDYPTPVFHLPEGEQKKLANAWWSSQKKIVLCGLLPSSDELENSLANLVDENTVVLSEITSNLHHPSFLTGIDRLIHLIDKKEFCPDILVTIGHSFISKKLKLWLRDFRPKSHWHIGLETVAQDTFQSLTQHLRTTPEYLFDTLVKHKGEQSNKSGFHFNKKWSDLALKINQQQAEYISNAPWSDLKIFDWMLSRLPSNIELHLGNSSPVRYADLFPRKRGCVYRSNRGVSGIDGCNSTALGAAKVSDKTVMLITGDISFFYDSNAFWNVALPANLKIVVINNQGGGIFRMIPGPGTTAQLDHFFETTHSFSAEGICNTFGVNYYSAKAEKINENTWEAFLGEQTNGQPAVLEIFTPRTTNDIVFKKFYAALSTRP